MADRRPATVLIVEDETFVRMVAADSLSEDGFCVLEAADALSALSLLDENAEVDVLFTDVNMPGDLDGLELADIVAVRRPEIKLVVTSGAQRLNASQLPDHGVYLAKPYRADELKIVLHAQIGD